MNIKNHIKEEILDTSGLHSMNIFSSFVILYKLIILLNSFNTSNIIIIWNVPRAKKIK